jgi:hypothetical protein
LGNESAPSGRLYVFGLCSLAIYVGLAVFFWTAWTHKANSIDEVIVIAAMLGLGLLYFLGLRLAPAAATSVIVIFACCAALVGFATPPFDSTDVFFYMASGWNQAHYGANPYSVSLREVAANVRDPMMQNEWIRRNRNPWLDIPMPYGFLFALVSGGIAWLGRGNFWLTLVLFDLVNLAFHAGTAILLWKAGKLLPEGSGKVMLYLYAWNPFIVLQYLADLHNDIIVAFLVLLAAYCILKDRPVWSLPLLVAAGLVKYISFILTPFALLYIVRHKGWKEGFKGVVWSAALAGATAAPYIKDAASFKYRLIWAQLSESSGSLHTFLVYSLRGLGRIWPSTAGLTSVFALVLQILLWIVFVSFVGWELWLTWRDRSEQPLTMLQRWTSILFGLIFIVSSQFYAWYLGMLFPLALLTHRKTILADAVVALSGAHMLSFTFLRRKAIGYFLVATALPIFYLVLTRRNGGISRTEEFPPALF